MLATSINPNLSTQAAPCSITEALANLGVHIQNADKDHTERQLLKTGLTDFDEAFGGLHKGALTVLASRPSMGRSALALNIAANVGITQQHTTLYFSLEMPIGQLAMRLASQLGKVEVSALQSGQLSADQEARLSIAADKAHDCPLYLMYDPYIDVHCLCQKAREFAKHQNRENPLSLLVIDDLGLMDLQMEKIEHKSAYENALYLLKELARELNVAVLLLSPVNRSAEEREDKRPVFSDLPSVAVARQSDALLFLYRDKVYRPQGGDIDRAELIYSSNRFGRTGTVYLATNLKYGRFEA